MWTIIVITIMYVVLVMLPMAKSSRFSLLKNYHGIIIIFIKVSIISLKSKEIAKIIIIIHVHQKDLEVTWSGGSAEFTLLFQCCVFFESQKIIQYVCTAPVFLSCARIRDY